MSCALVRCAVCGGGGKCGSYVCEKSTDSAVLQCVRSMWSITLSEPRVDLTDASLGDWLQPKTEMNETDSVKRSVYKIIDLEVTGGKLIADSTFVLMLHYGVDCMKIDSDYGVNGRPATLKGYVWEGVWSHRVRISKSQGS